MIYFLSGVIYFLSGVQCLVNHRPTTNQYSKVLAHSETCWQVTLLVPAIIPGSKKEALSQYVSDKNILGCHRTGS